MDILFINQKHTQFFATKEEAKNIVKTAKDFVKRMSELLAN